MVCQTSFQSAEGRKADRRVGSAEQRKNELLGEKFGGGAESRDVWGHKRRTQGGGQKWGDTQKRNWGRKVGRTWEGEEKKENEQASYRYRIRSKGGSSTETAKFKG